MLEHHVHHARFRHLLHNLQLQGYDWWSAVQLAEYDAARGGSLLYDGRAHGALTERRWPQAE